MTNDHQSSQASSHAPTPDPIDIQIRNSPVHSVNLLATSTVKFIGIPSPTTYTQHPVTQPKMTTTATTTQTAQATSTVHQTTTAFIQSLNDAFDNALNWNPPGGGGGGGGGGGEGGDGGGGGGNPPANALQPIPQPRDVRAMGKQPESFYGNRTKAEEFIEEVQGYLCLNADIAGLNSPRNKIVFTLTCMKGSEVAGWTKNIGHMVDRLDPAQNVPLLWDHFLQEFDRQYMVSIREDRARKKLSKLTMKDYDIDAYIAKFEELSRQASYTIGNQESIQ
jgi:hypothetical protein